MTITAHPLTWPADWKRTPEVKRKPGHFGKRASTGHGYSTKQDLTVFEAAGRLLDGVEHNGMPEVTACAR